MSETWDAIQAIKSKQSSMRARMLERKRQRQDLAAEIKNGENAIAWQRVCTDKPVPNGFIA